MTNQVQFQFDQFLLRHQLKTEGNKILLAVSGGVDSMVLLELFYQAGIHVEVAHMNFQLRGVESEQDEKFVLNQCEKRGIICHLKKVETHAFAIANKMNTQLAARELRYQWFNSLLEKGKLTYLATAHHASDHSETLLINLLRGTGPEGLRGIAECNDKLIRPLLRITKEQIEEFAHQTDIHFREDSSNLTDKYVRNKLRHHVVPVLKEINPSFEQSFLQSADILRDVWNLLQDEIQKFENYCLSKNDNHVEMIDIQQIVTYPHYHVLLYYILNRYGVNRAVYQNILKSFSNSESAEFITTTHRISNDRGNLYLEKLGDEELGFEFEINGPGTYETHIGTFKVEKLIKEQVRMTDSKMTALLDAEKCQFPILIKNWQHGDAFVPLGMTGKKLLSDFFIDEKVPNHEKNRIPICHSVNAIIWVAGKRISHLHKISGNTQFVLRLSWLPL